ncbi:MAG: NBR1-Ig-like domain-containing protein [Solirubrobacteraceae bacterium]
MPRARKAGWDQPVGDRPNQHVGAMLHGLREQAGVTQGEVAADIGIDQSYISRIERGSRPASDRIIRYYGERFGAPDLLASLVEIARESERDRRRRRDPLLIARQARYPLDGDEARFVAETPPDGVTVPCGATFTKSWTIRNSGSVPWHGRRLRRIGPTTGPWTLTSERFTSIPGTEPGDEVTVSVELRTPKMETAAVAQWKMVDADDLLYFPTVYSVGLGLYVLVGHDGSPTLPRHGDDSHVG